LPLVLQDSTTIQLLTLSLHDALPICFNPLTGGAGRAVPVTRLITGTRLNAADLWRGERCLNRGHYPSGTGQTHPVRPTGISVRRSEEHTSELQSRENLVCRLLLEKKK